MAYNNFRTWVKDLLPGFVRASDTASRLAHIPAVMIDCLAEAVRQCVVVSSELADPTAIDLLGAENGIARRPTSFLEAGLEPISTYAKRVAAVWDSSRFAGTELGPSLHLGLTWPGVSCEIYRLEEMGINDLLWAKCVMYVICPESVPDDTGGTLGVPLDLSVSAADYRRAYGIPAHMIVQQSLSILSSVSTLVGQRYFRTKTIADLGTKKIQDLGYIRFLFSA